MQAPVMILNTNTRRETGYTAQLSTIQAATNIAKIVRTTLGPLSMLKMLLDPMGGIVITNDGNAILREIDVAHPAGKSIIELSRGQDEEVGDGTTSVIILTGEFLCLAEPFLSQQFHPTTIINGYMKALNECIQYMKSIAKPVNLEDKQELFQLVQATVGTKFSPKLSLLISQLAVDAVLMITRDLQTSKSNAVQSKHGDTQKQNGSTTKDIDIKRYIKIEKIPGGELADCHVLHGIMINKDVTHSQMRREIINPRILLLDCPLEYKKGESQVNVEITKEDDWNTLLRLEEEYIENMCAQIVAMKPDIVITEKGVSDLAQHYFVKANITALRRLRKTDNNRLARACGATIVSRADEIQESDIGTLCGKFKVDKIGDEYFSYFTECKEPKACTILLRGGSKDVLNEMERNLHDAMQSARNIVIEPVLVPGGGAIEMACSAMLKRKVITGTEQYPYLTIAKGLEVIPRTLLQNCGADVVRVMTSLRAKHASNANATQANSYTWGVDGIKGSIIDMSKEGGIWEPLTVKTQTIKTSIEASCMLLRIDDIVSGLAKKKE